FAGDIGTCKNHERNWQKPIDCQGNGVSLKRAPHRIVAVAAARWIIPLQTFVSFVAAKMAATNDKLTSHEPIDNYAPWLKETGRKTNKVRNENHSLSPGCYRWHHSRGRSVACFCRG